MDELLAQHAEEEQVPKVVLVHGHAGFGKTQLVRAYCRAQVNRGIAFRWLDASNIGILRASLLSFAQEAGLVPTDFHLNYDRHGQSDISAQREIQKLLKFVESLSQSWLLVYDNYDVPDDESFDLRSYFPGGKRGRIIVTSRNRGVATDIGATCLLVESMSVLESIELLRETIKPSAMGPSHSAENLQREIVTDLLGCHPLAIAQAGAYICNNIVPKTMHLEERLVQFKKRFLAHETEMLVGDKSTLVKEYGRSVITSWDMSFRTILQQDHTAAELLLFFGFMHHTNIPQQIFAEAYRSRERLDEQDSIIITSQPYTWLQAILVSDDDGQWDSTVLEDCLGLLERYSLIRVTHGLNYSMHPLVHTWTRLGKITTAEELEARARLALVLLSYTYEKDYDRSPRKVVAHMRAISHLESCIRFSQKHTKLLTLTETPPTVRLGAKCLLNICKLLDGQATNWQFKARQLQNNLSLLAVINGSIDNGIHNASTMEAFVFVLGLMVTYIECADAVERLSQVMLNVIPLIESEEEGLSSAELYFSFLSVRLAALCRTVTPQVFAKAEKETLAWVDSHRHEMSPSFYLSRKARIHSLSISVVGLNANAATLSDLQLFLNEIEAELGKDSDSAWRTRLNIAICLEKMGKQTEANDILRMILQNCKTSAGDSRNLLTSASYKLIGTLIPQQAYGDLLKVKQSLVETQVKTLGPYHEDTLKEKNDVLNYESRLIRDTNVNIYPVLLGSQAYYAYTNGGLGLDQLVVCALENAMVCETLGRHAEIPPLWKGVINHARVSSRPETFFQNFRRASKAAADASDRQGYHFLALILRTSSCTLETRMAANRAPESKVMELERLKIVWDDLVDLHEASKIKDNAKARQIAEDVYSKTLKSAPKEARPAIVWLVTQYVRRLFELEITNVVSPITYHTLGQFQRLAFKYFKSDNIMAFQVMGSLSVCYRLYRKVAPAVRIENYLVERFIEEAVETFRTPGNERHWGKKATPILNRLFRGYYGRKWYSENIRMFEIIIRSLTKEIGPQAEETIKYVRFVCELYGRLGILDKIDSTLGDLMEPFQDRGESDEQVLFKQLYLVVDWCLVTKQFLAAQGVISWLAANGVHLLDASTKARALHDLEALGGTLENEDFVAENNRLKAALQ